MKIRNALVRKSAGNIRRYETLVLRQGMENLETATTDELHGLLQSSYLNRKERRAVEAELKRRSSKAS